MKRKNTALKGRKLVQLAKQILEAQGAKVEVAANQIRWWQDAQTKRWVPRSVKHDFFGVWDLLAVFKNGARQFYQVTTAQNLAAHRSKILEVGPWAEQDGILAWRGGRGRHFLVYRGPIFELASVRWEPIKTSRHRPSAVAPAHPHEKSASVAAVHVRGGT